MQKLTGIAILCMIPGLISFLIYRIWNRKNEREEGDDLKKIIFFCLYFYGLLSFIKLVLGEKNISLYESFADIVPQTYRHYCVPLLIASIIIPLALQIMLGRKSIREFALFFDSCMFVETLIVYTIFGNVSNFWFVICFIFAGGTSIVKCFIYRGEVFYCNSIVEAKKRLKLVLSVMVFWAFTVVVYLPNELYLYNIEEFQLTYSSYFNALLIGSLIFVASSTVGILFFLTEKQCKLVSVVIFGYTFCGYIQGNFLNGTLMALDGTKQVWSTKTMIINLIIWILLFAGILFLSLLKKKDNICIFLSICLCLMQLVSLVTLELTTDKEKDSEYALTTDGILELDNENNVVVFVLDWYDEQIMEKVYADDSSFLQPLNDFTWYQNATSCYAFTGMSIPYLLTGTKWKYDMLEEDYCKYAYDNSDFLQQLKDAGYSIGIYTEPAEISSDLKDIAINYKNVQERKCKISDTFSMMTKCSKYKMAPFIMKSKYWYASSDISGLIVNDDVYKTFEDWSFYNLLLENGISTKDIDGKGAFRFIHMYGAHLPYIMDEEIRYHADSTMLAQAKGCLNIVYEYLNQMKKKGVYDDATIIITADHGQNTYLQNRDDANKAGFDMTSNPILFVKQRGVSGKENMDISMAPVSHEEFIPTIKEAVGIGNQPEDRSFDEISELEVRDRVFIYGRHYDFPFKKYIISGNVRDEDCWNEGALP